jgi:hypothetical protein
MPESAPPTHAHVAFLRIPGFDGRGVSEQASLKDRLEGRVRAALSGIPEAERIVLDADDGVALVLFGPPARALRIAQSLRGEEAFLQVGLNHGPLAVTDQGPGARVFGDGLASAAAAARFATPERILVTQDFLRALEIASPELAPDLVGAGEFTDTRVRQHLLYTPDPRRRVQRRRRYALQLFGGALAILFLGVAAREVQHRFFPPVPAVVTLAIKPRGDIYVDGVSRGRSPPLTRLELGAGHHVITVRASGFPPLEITLNLKPGEETTIAHTFAAPRRAEPQAPKEAPNSFWRDLKRKFGGS